MHEHHSRSSAGGDGPRTARLCVLAAVLLTAGCGIGRGIGRNAAAGLQESEPSLIALEARLADSMAAFMGREMKTHVLDQARGTWITMRGDAITGMDTILAHTTVALEGGVRRALADLLRGNLATLDSGGEALVTHLADSLARRLETTVAHAADSVGYAAAVGLSRGIDAELTPVLLRVLDSLRLGVREELQVALQNTGRTVERQVGVHPLIVGLIVAALIGTLTLNWLGNAAHRRSLERLLAREGHAPR